MTMDLQIDDFLEAQDLDAVMALVLNLATEVIELQERVGELERGGVPDADSLQERIDELVGRVGAPFSAGRDLL